MADKLFNGTARGTSQFFQRLSLFPDQNSLLRISFHDNVGRYPVLSLFTLLEVDDVDCGGIRNFFGKLFEYFFTDDLTDKEPFLCIAGDIRIIVRFMVRELFDDGTDKFFGIK